MKTEKEEELKQRLDAILNRNSMRSKVLHKILKELKAKQNSNK